MAFLEILLFAFGALYVLLSILLTIGIAQHSKVDNDYEPSVSIIVPVRNEEDTISRCLSSLEALDYPKNKIEIVIVDDHSDDHTVLLIRDFCRRNSHLALFSLGEKPCDSNEGKIAALAYGFKKAAGEIILQTDADCAVPKNWVRSMVSQFGNSVGIAGGMTLLETSDAGQTWFDRIQSLDWMYLLGVGAGACGIGVPLSCFGNNMAIRRSAYKEAGGYEAIPFTYTEDFAIFRAISCAGWKSGFALEESALVHSLPPKTFGAFLNQRLRWASGGIKLAGLGMILLAAAFFLHLLMIISVMSGIDPLLWASVLLATSVSDLIFLFMIAHKVNKVKLLVYFPLFELYFYLYTTIFGLALPFFSSLSWKGRKF